MTETELLGAGLLTGFFWRRVERLAFLQFFFHGRAHAVVIFSSYTLIIVQRLDCKVN